MGIFPKKRNREQIILRRINFILQLYQFEKPLILDDGAGSGKIAIGLQNKGSVVGIDRALNFQKRGNSHKGTQFINATGEYLPFKSNIFNVIVSQMVVEHVSDDKKYLEESYRVLKPKGIVYLSFPNRMFPIEPHTKIPLITYLPHAIFQRIVNSKMNKKYALQYLTYRVLKPISIIGFKKVRDIVPFFLKSASQFYPSIPDFLCRLLSKTYKILRFFVPTWIWVLEKD